MFVRVTGIILSILVLPFFLSCTVVKHGEDKGNEGEGVTFYFESEDFDAASYVKEAWDSRIIPEIKEKAQPLAELLMKLEADGEGTSAEYGIRKEDSSPYNFIVKGQYPVKELDRSSAAGLLVLNLPDARGEGFCKIQIGPVIKKSAVRDVLSFINFGDFSNQIEYANISREINFYIRDHVVDAVGETLPAESEVSFHGAFTQNDSGEIVITPVLFEIIPGE